MILDDIVCKSCIKTSKKYLLILYFAIHSNEKKEEILTTVIRTEYRSLGIDTIANISTISFISIMSAWAKTRRISLCTSSLTHAWSSLSTNSISISNKDCHRSIRNESSPFVCSFCRDKHSYRQGIIDFWTWISSVKCYSSKAICVDFISSRGIKRIDAQSNP